MAHYLIIARSARALATSAKRSKHNVHCLDCFVDEDTKNLADSVNVLQYQSAGFIEAEVLGQVQALVDEYPDIRIVTGTGFEARPEQITLLRQLAPVISNNVNTIRKLKTPDYVRQLLRKHSIKHPLTRLSKPNKIAGYLVKKTASSGGIEVQWLKQVTTLKPRYYYQKFVAGNVLSAVFLADGKQARLVGFNQQLQTTQFQESPFLYQGAIALNLVRTELVAKQHQESICRIINIITHETGLVGLCGLDFILDDTGVIYVLEVNPRAPATFELHEHEQSLFDAHIACFEGTLLDYRSEYCSCFKGSAVLYAEQVLMISKNINWPNWVKDRPAMGSLIPRRFPVCSVYADAISISETHLLLFDRLKQIETTIMTMQNAA